MTAPRPIDYLTLLRSAEIAAVRPWFDAGERVLEIGGGNGHQASVLASWGCSVRSVDIAPDKRDAHFEVEDYDGAHLPSADASVDRVFSSNVLEHVRDVPGLLGEIRRVLRKGGLAIHLMPSPAWRAWNMVAHYGYLAEWAAGVARPLNGASAQPELGDFVRRKGKLWMVRRALGVGVHGEYPSVFSELYYYRRSIWTRILEAGGFRVVESRPGGVFYTGYGLLGTRLGRPLREALAPWLGSACNLFVTEVR